MSKPAAETAATKGTLVERLERFTFTDGVRLALVTWRIGDGERRCVAVREVPRAPLGCIPPVPSPPWQPPAQPSGLALATVPEQDPIETE